MPTFLASEFISRIKSVKSRMVAKGLDVLLITSPENIYYLTGYCGESYYTHQIVVLNLTEPMPTIILRDMDTACAEHTVFMPQKHVIGYPEHYIGDEAHPFDFISDFLHRTGVADQKIGIEMDSHFFTAKAFQILNNRLPNATFQDAFLLVNWVRTYKSPAEITYMTQAGKLAQLSLESAIKLIEPGVRECDIAAEISQTQIKGSPEFGGQTTYFSLASGARAAAAHLGWTDEVYTNNTPINIELAGKRHYYCAALSRSIYIGTPPSQLIDLSNAVLESLTQALEAVRPGQTCEMVEAAWRQSICKFGYEKASRIGYSMGIELCPTWIDLTASLQPGDKTVLQANMVFHIICGMWKGEHNFIISETVVVTETGYVLLPSLEQKLFIK